MGLLNRALDPMDILNGLSYLIFTASMKKLYWGVKIILFLHENTIFIYQSKRLKINLFLIKGFLIEVVLVRYN
jgi:hypothetical protein